VDLAVHVLPIIAKHAHLPLVVKVAFQAIFYQGNLAVHALLIIAKHAHLPLLAKVAF